MASSVEEIKARLSITDVVGSYIKLEKAGASYKALCPFHHEKSPSFNVSLSRQAYYCFGCNRGGDIFTFVQEIEGIDFLESLKLLADRAGVVLEKFEKEEKGEKGKILSLLEDAVHFYESGLSEHDGPREYLKERGLEDMTISEWHVGYIPPPEISGWRSLHTFLRGKGYTDQEIESAGLTKKTDKGYYDRFRGRIMFPIRDLSGRTVAFTGRVFGQAKETEAKYVNSPETLLYDKSSVLFGYDMAKSAIRKQNFCVMVEGQMDCIMAHQAGSENVVAVSGTALTEKHLELVKRLTTNLVFAFDTDQAGVSATLRAYAMALGLGMNVRVAEIPDAKDPADLILHDRALWEKSLTESRHIVDYMMTVLSNEHTDVHELRKSVEEKIIPLVLSIPSKIEQAHFIMEIARKLGVKEDVVYEEVKRRSHLVSYPAARQEGEVVKQITPQMVTPRVSLEEHVLSIIYWQEGLDEPAIDVGAARDRYLALFARYRMVPRELSDQEALKFSMQAEHTHEHGQELAGAVDELLVRLEKEVIKERQSELWQKLAEAERRDAKDEAKKILQEYQSLTPRLIELEGRGEG